MGKMAGCLLLLASMAVLSFWPALTAPLRRAPRAGEERIDYIRRLLQEEQRKWQRDIWVYAGAGFVAGIGVMLLFLGNSRQQEGKTEPTPAGDRLKAPPED